LYPVSVLSCAKTKRKEYLRMLEANPQHDLQNIYGQIRNVLTKSRARALQAVNYEMVVCYWEIGKLIVEEEQRGESRAEYGKRLIRELSKKLSKEFGKGFDKSNLWNMRAFFMTYP